MATATSTLIQRTRRYLRDWPDLDALTASVSDTTTTIPVGTGTQFAANWDIEIDSELMIVRSVSSNNLTVKRGAKGSTAASHASAASVLVRPHFSSVEILDALNRGLDACFPLLYQPVIDESLTILADTYEYTVPSVNSSPIPYVSTVELKDDGDDDYYPVRSCYPEDRVSPGAVYGGDGAGEWVCAVRAFDG
jgi:hypothetical protein